MRTSFIARESVFGPIPMQKARKMERQESYTRNSWRKFNKLLAINKREEGEIRRGTKKTWTRHRRYTRNSDKKFLFFGRKSRLLGIFEKAKLKCLCLIFYSATRAVKEKTKKCQMQAKRDKSWPQQTKHLGKTVKSKIHLKSSIKLRFQHVV